MDSREKEEQITGEIVVANGLSVPIASGESIAVMQAEVPEKVSLKTKIVHEVIEVGAVMLYLFASFAVLETFRCGTLLAECSQNDFYAGYTTAALGALALGKFVFILDKMKFMQQFVNKPLIYPIIYKTVLFTILVNFILHAEDRILHRVEPHHAFRDTTEFILCTFAHQLAFFITFFIFFCFRGVSRVVGEKRMFRMFFVSRDGDDPANSNTATTTTNTTSTSSSSSSR